MGQVAATYAGSFAPFMGWNPRERGIISTAGADALLAIPAANATIAAGLANTALEQAGANEGIKLQLDQRKWETQRTQRNNRQQRALLLAQAFSGGGGSSGGVGFMPLPGFDAENAVKMMFGLNTSSRADGQAAGAGTRAATAGVMNNLTGLTKLQG